MVFYSFDINGKPLDGFFTNHTKYTSKLDATAAKLAGRKIITKAEYKLVTEHITRTTIELAVLRPDIEISALAEDAYHHGEMVRISNKLGWNVSVLNIGDLPF